jgi:hypothetical protein
VNAVSRALGSGLALALALGLGSSACNDRFQFDVPVAGAGGAAGTGGVGGVAAGGTTAGNGGVAAGGTTAGNGGVAAGGGEAGRAGNSGSDAVGGSGGTALTACGNVAACPADLHCAGNLCAQCANDADCGPSGLPRCDLIRHRCVACVMTADCEVGFACDSLANRCLKKCKEDVDCKGLHGCDEGRLVCYHCDEDKECAGSALGSLCASDGSGCVQCRKDADCPNQHCDQLVGRCVACRDGTDCPSHLCSPSTFTCLPN